MGSTLEVYKKAFSLALDVPINNFKIKRHFEGEKDKSCLVKTDSGIYLVSSYEDLYTIAEEYLTDSDMARYLDAEACDEIFEEVHLNIEFYDKLLGLIEKDQWPELNMALNLYKISSIPFWNSIYTYCDSEIYGIAVVTASDFYDLDCLKDELVEYIISNGHEFLSPFREGFFKEVLVKENSFFVYSVDNEYE